MPIEQALFGYLFAVTKSMATKVVFIAIHLPVFDRTLSMRVQIARGQD
jgi:hypothetical protein